MADCQLTVVISYYNIRFLDQTLYSLKIQTNSNFKIFIGNDKSKDNPIDIIDKYSGFLNIEYIEFDHNLGGVDLTLQWQRCLNYITTSYFLILGDDDCLSEDVVEGFYQSIEQHPEGKVYRYDIIRVDEDNKHVSSLVSCKSIEDTKEFICLRAQNKLFSSLGEYVFRLTDYRRYGIKSYPKAFYSDNWMILNYAVFEDIISINLGHIYIRVSKYSISGNADNTIALLQAGYLFYYDLIYENGSKFTKAQKYYFMLHVVSGYVKKFYPINFFKFLKLLYTNLLFKDFVYLLCYFSKTYIRGIIKNCK